MATEAPLADGEKPAEPAKPKGGLPDTKIDLDGIDQRILSVPMPTRRYASLQVGKPGTLLALESPGGDGPAVHRSGKLRPL